MFLSSNQLCFDNAIFFTSVVSKSAGHTSEILWTCCIWPGTLTQACGKSLREVGEGYFNRPAVCLDYIYLQI